MAKYDVLVFSAHPDDAERHMGATIAHLALSKYRVLMVSLTAGQMGTYGDSETRKREFVEAANILGVKSLVLDFLDAAIFDDLAGRKKIASVIRQHKPSLVFAPYPHSSGIHGVNAHPDHEATGLIVTHAISLATIAKIDALPAHRVYQLLYYMLPQGVTPSILAAVTNEEMQLALQAVDAHVSQEAAYKGIVPLPEYLISLRRFPHRKTGALLPIGCDLCETFLSAAPVVLRGSGFDLFVPRA